MFGYPISEPYEVDGVWCQWFQRQLVMYDARRPAGEQVWRAKLGEDVLNWRRIAEFKDRSASRVNWALALESRNRPGVDAGRVVGVVGGYWLPSGRAGYPAIEQLTLSPLDRLPEKLSPAYAPLSQWTLVWRGAPIIGDASASPTIWCWTGQRYASGVCA